MNVFSCDFETNNSRTECRVWLYGIWDIYTEEFMYGNSIEDFWYKVTTLARESGSITLTFHNLAFDGEFLLIYLLKNEYTINATLRKKLGNKEINTLISDMNVWYSIEVKIDDNARVKIINSLRLFPFKLKELSKTFGMKEEKGEIDYNYVRPIGYEPSEKEIDYIKRDCIIAGKAVRHNLDCGLNKMTIGSNALNFYKTLITKKSFDYWFPKLSIEEDDFIRKSYRGGWTYANKRFIGKEVGKGIVLDVNSLYPSRMYYELLPYGRGVYYKGKYIEDKGHPLYVQRIKCKFKLKKGRFPTIQLHHQPGFMKTEYVESSNGEIVELTLTNVDLELFFEQYNVSSIVYLDGYKYSASNTMFKDYVDYWMEKKLIAEKKHDKAGRALAKLMLNNLYGKFAKRPKGRSKIPELKEDGSLRLKLGEEEDQGSLFIPVGTFITAYARAYTIRSAQKLSKRFLYADTDSLHLIGMEPAEGIEVDQYELGKWKHESDFRRAKYLGAKCYCEEIYSTREEIIKHLREYPCQYTHVNMHRLTILDIKCAGMTESCKDTVNFENFEIGLETYGKLRPVHVPNGITLEMTTFKIKERGKSNALVKV